MQFKLVESELINRKFHIYTDGVSDVRVYDGDTPPLGFTPGSHYNRTPWNKGLTADVDDRVKKNTEASHKTRKANNNYSAWNKGLTKETDDRIHGMLGKSNPMYGKHPNAWNKGLTKETDSRMLLASNTHKGSVTWNKGLTSETDSRIVSRPRDEETKKKISASHKKPEVQYKRFNSMKANGTLGHNLDTLAELDYYNQLLKNYDVDDIIHPYIDQERYPYKCDFYIISEDKFIEVHGNWTHGGHPFDKNNPEDLNKLSQWEEKAKTSDYYKNAIYTWTDLDVRKSATANKNNLNFEAVYYNYNK